MEKEHPKKKEAQKRYREALSALNRKVKDHDHINGKYRGPAHDSCDKKLRIGSFETKVPLICHNFRGYDSHLLIEVGRFTANRLKCIPEHVAMGLDILVESFGGKLEKLPLSVKHFTEKGHSLDQIKSLTKRKGVFPYDWTHGTNLKERAFHAEKIFILI